MGLGLGAISDPPFFYRNACALPRAASPPVLPVKLRVPTIAGHQKKNGTHVLSPRRPPLRSFVLVRLQVLVVCLNKACALPRAASPHHKASLRYNHWPTL